jgi:hypothetical protein
MFEMLLKEHSATSSLGRCSIDTLPEEIWTQIIQSYAKCEDYEPPSISVDLLLPLMLVSTRWQRRIQDTPTLWTDIVLLEETEDLSLKVALGLHYSNTAPLSLFLYSSRAWSAVRSMAPSMQPRISALIIDDILSEKEIEIVINDLCPLPSLTRMSEPGCQCINETFFLQHPFITDLYVIGVPPTDLCTHLSKLTKLLWYPSPDMDISTIFQLLGRMQFLQEVTSLS